MSNLCMELFLLKNFFFFFIPLSPHTNPLVWVLLFVIIKFSSLIGRRDHAPPGTGASQCECVCVCMYACVLLPAVIAFATTTATAATGEMKNFAVLFKKNKIKYSLPVGSEWLILLYVRNTKLYDQPEIFLFWIPQLWNFL